MKCGFCGKELTDEWITDTYWRGDGIADEETAFCNDICRDKAKEAL